MVKGGEGGTQKANNLNKRDTLTGGIRLSKEKLSVRGRQKKEAGKYKTEAAG